MFRVLAISCLVLSVIAGPIESDAPIQQRAASGGMQKFSAGKRVAGDKLIWSGTGHQVIDFAHQIITDVPFPQENGANKAAITQIVASTMLDTGNSQFSIVSGGIGKNDVMLRVTSNYAHKISYKIEIYGK